MKCQKCGTEFEGLFCPECGAKANDSELNDTITENAQGTNEMSETATQEEIKSQAEQLKREAQIEIGEKKQEAEIRKQEAQAEIEKRKQEAEIRKQEAQAEIEKRKQEAEIRKQEALVEIERKKQEAELAKQEAEAKRNEAELLKQQNEKERLEREKEKEAERQRKKAENAGKKEAVISLICGIVALLSFGIFIAPEIIGIIYSKKGCKNGKMRGAAKAGLICSILSIVILAIAIAYSFFLS